MVSVPSAALAALAAEAVSACGEAAGAEAAAGAALAPGATLASPSAPPRGAVAPAPTPATAGSDDISLRFRSGACGSGHEGLALSALTGSSRPRRRRGSA